MPKTNTAPNQAHPLTKPWPHVAHRATQGASTPSTAPKASRLALTSLMLGAALPLLGHAQEAPSDTVLPTVRARAKAETSPGKTSLRATTTSIGKGDQALRDVPQSITVVTEKLIDDRNIDTLKEALKSTAGIAFQAAEGGEEDIRLRGFSLQASGDIFIDGIRDPAFYERDSFNWDRLEVLRGSASMLFGRGSTGGAANQVSKLPFLLDQNDMALTLGTGSYLRWTADFNRQTTDTSALRINMMANTADNFGNKISRVGLAPTLRWNIGSRDEFTAGLYLLDNDNGIHYGLPWLNNTVWTRHNDTKAYYGAASDYNRSATAQAFVTHLRRIDHESQIKTALRVASYERDQRASAIRFAAAALQPGGQAVTPDTLSDATVLTRGTNNKTMSLGTAYLQSDYSGKHRWWGFEHAVQAGVDLAKEQFANFAATVPAGGTLTKPVTTVGASADGATVDEALRVLIKNRTFDAQGVGVYAQDLLALNERWKLLGGLRWDHFKGAYRNLAVAPVAGNPCSVQPNASIERADSLFSHRFGVLYQPSPRQSYHLSYGTSFNTSGDTYQYDPGTAKVDPEKSRNLELGAKLESADGRVSTRLALFHSTKYNERNRDAESVNACNYVLSGKRHAAGVEADVVGRLTSAWELYLSYTFIPVARVDASTGAAGTEAIGSRPGLTPKHSGSLWTTYKLLPGWRVGGGLTMRSSDRPVGLAANATLQAPGFVVGDLMAEYTARDWSFKAYLNNITDRHYADYLYRGHYVPGRARQLQMTVSYRF